MTNYQQMEDAVYAALCHTELFDIGFSGTSKEIFAIICDKTELQTLSNDEELYHCLCKCLEVHNNCIDNKYYGEFEQHRDISKVHLSNKKCKYTFGQII